MASAVAHGYDGAMSTVQSTPAFTLVPRLESERLEFHGHRVEDFADSFALWSDPQVTRFIGGKPSTEEEAWARLLRTTGHWVLLGFGYWVIREKSSGRFVGEVGFGNFRRTLSSPLPDVPEAGWVLAPWAHGKGYATEAVTAALHWAEGRFGHARACCIIAPENRPSIRVAERCGFREVRRTEYHGSPTVVFER